jgi:undecaprenyl-diphosphatase
MQSELLLTINHYDAQIVRQVLGVVTDSEWLIGLAYILAQWLLPLMFISLVVLWNWPRAIFDRSRIQGNKKTVALSLLTVAMALAVKSAVGFAIYRPRPFISDPSLPVDPLMNLDPGSFPSGHALLAFSLAASIWIAGYRRAGLLLILAAAGVAVGRVAIGVHYPSDVIAGAALGTLIAVFMHRETNTIKQYLPNA